MGETLLEVAEEDSWEVVGCFASSGHLTLERLSAPEGSKGERGGEEWQEGEGEEASSVCYDPEVSAEEPQ